MAFYRVMGEIPKKRHIQFHKPDGSLYREQVMGTKGFSGIQSILYHHFAPTEVVKAELHASATIEFEDQTVLRHRHFFTDRQTKTGDAVCARSYLLGNDDLLIAT